MVGVAPDGRFVTVSETWGGGSGVDRTTIEVRDRDGAVETTIAYCAGCEPDEDDATVVGSFVVSTHGRPAPVPTDAKPSTVLARLKAKLGLTPLKKAQVRVTTGPSKDVSFCAIAMRTADGPATLTVVPIDYGPGLEDDVCSGVTVRLSSHRHSPLSFVRYSYGGGQGGCETDVTSVHWFPTSRLAVARDLARANKLGPKRSAQKVAALDKVIEADPGYLPARLALAKLLSESDVVWADASKHLSVPLPSKREQVFEDHFTYTEGLSGLWPDEDYDAWLEGHVATLMALWRDPVDVDVDEEP